MQIKAVCCILKGSKTLRKRRKVERKMLAREISFEALVYLCCFMVLYFTVGTFLEKRCRKLFSGHRYFFEILEVVILIVLAACLKNVMVPKLELISELAWSVLTDWIAPIWNVIRSKYEAFLESLMELIFY